MEPWLFTATLINGGRIELGAAVEVRMVTSLDSPAASLEAQFPLFTPPAQIHEIHTSGFSGFIDQQVGISSGGGSVLRIEARSRGRLLLDNEAKAQIYYNATLRDIFDRHIAPYGFMLEEPGTQRLSSFAVGRGMCQWQVLSAFCRGLGTAMPVVNGENRVTLHPVTHTAPIVISNSAREGELPFISLKDTLKRFGVPSEMIMTADRDGRTVRVSNPYAPQYKLSCSRFITPRAEFSHTSDMDAENRIKSANLGMRLIKAELPGLHDIAPGSSVDINDDICREQGLFVWSTEKKLTSGAFTTLTLARKIFYQGANL